MRTPLEDLDNELNIPESPMTTDERWDDDSWVEQQASISSMNGVADFLTNSFDF